MMDLWAYHNIIGGAACAAFAVATGTRLNRVGWRNYSLIMAAAILTAAALVDWEIGRRGFFASCLVGFAVGYLADDVVLNLNATLPEFIRGITRDILNWVRDWIFRRRNK